MRESRRKHKQATIEQLSFSFEKAELGAYQGSTRSREAVPFPTEIERRDPPDNTAVPQQEQAKKYQREEALVLLLEIGEMIWFSENKIQPDEIARMMDVENWKRYWSKEDDDWIQVALRKWKPKYDAILAQQRQGIELVSNIALGIGGQLRAQEIESLTCYDKETLVHRGAHDQVRRALLLKWAQENGCRGREYTYLNSENSYISQTIPQGLAAWADFTQKATPLEVYCCFVCVYAPLPLEHSLKDAQTREAHKPCESPYEVKP